MPGDYTRFTFDPFEDHFRVLMQQGRVTLDADFNEMAEIIGRQFRVRMLDTVGRCVVPIETPDGFRIFFDGGNLMIGRGRAYVHGLLAENHGAGDREWDRILAEERGTEAMPYTEQPYLPDPPLPGPDVGTQLVYLDVWERELTHVEDRDLVEKALGVDTAARVQTVWQVKLFEVPPGTTCATPDEDIPDWLDLVNPSGARLSTQAVGVAASDDPCIIDPAGGFRGIENRLYRVEVHDSGDLANATFKWSRDNASISTRVTAVDAGLDTLTLTRIGRDGVRRISSQDWVEILDDRIELAGQPGALHKVQSVDEVNEQITLEVPLAAGVIDQANPQLLNTRVRRWDQKGQVLDSANVVVADVDANAGVIPTNAGGGTMVLEDGVEVTFSEDASGGGFRTGDSWVFAARTVDASVEVLDVAPPRAIHHHYCRLAVVGRNRDVIDCRIFWPPPFGEAGCDCTECVSADEHNSGVFTIQMAIDRVRAAGGKVCLGPGLFNLGTQPVQLHGLSSVQLHGHGFRTILFYVGDGPAVSVERAINIEIDRLAVAAIGGQERPGMALGIAGSALVNVNNCALFQFGGPDRQAPAVGLSGLLLEVSLLDNVIFGGDGIRAVTGSPQDPAGGTVNQPGARDFLLTYGLRISDNLILGIRRGVDLGRNSIHLGENRVDDNQILGGTQASLLAQGFVPARFFPSRLEVRGNVVTATGDGLALGTNQARVSDNDIGVLGAPDQQGSPRHGIRLMPGTVQTPLLGCQLLSNRITGMSGDGIHITASLESIMIKQNILRDLGGGGIVMAEESEAENLAIENNQLLDVGLAVTDDSPLVGIRVQRAVEAQISANSIRGFAEASPQTALRAAVHVSVATAARLTGNDLNRIGPPGATAGNTFGILVSGPGDSIDVSGNSVRRGQTGGDLDAVRWIGIAVVGSTVGAQPAPNFDTALFAAAAAMMGPLTFVDAGAAGIAMFSELAIVILPRGAHNIGVRGNFVRGAGRPPLVAVLGPASATVTENRVLSATGSEPGTATVLAGGSHVVAGSNSIFRGPGGDDRDALRLLAPRDRVTVLGNIVEGGLIRVGTVPLTDPWKPLNVIHV